MTDQSTDDQKPADQKPTDQPSTFTQEQLNTILAEDRRKNSAKFADYDELKRKAAEFDKAADANKTELQKALDRATAAESKVAGFEAKQQQAEWAHEVSTATGVPADVLRGSTKEELQAHAELLKPAYTATPRRTSTPPGTPPEGSEKSRAAAALREWRHGA